VVAAAAAEGILLAARLAERLLRATPARGHAGAAVAAIVMVLLAERAVSGARDLAGLACQDRQDSGLLLRQGTPSPPAARPLSPPHPPRPGGPVALPPRPPLQPRRHRHRAGDGAGAGTVPSVRAADEPSGRAGPRGRAGPPPGHRPGRLQALR